MIPAPRHKRGTMPTEYTPTERTPKDRPGPGRRGTAAPATGAMLLAGLLAGLLAPAGLARPQEPVVSYRIVNASEIPDSLTGGRGDAGAGQALYFDQGKTGCSGCHGAPADPEAAARPAAGAPGLGEITGRLTEGEIRLWIVAPQVLAPDTAMPAYYAVGQRDDPKDPRFGEPRLTASEVEDLIAYLLRAGR